MLEKLRMLSPELLEAVEAGPKGFERSEQGPSGTKYARRDGIVLYLAHEIISSSRKSSKLLQQTALLSL